MLRFALSTIFFVFYFLSTSKDFNCTVILHIKNADSSYYAYIFNEDKTFYFDSTFETIDSFSVKLKEPSLVTYIVKNDTTGYMTFYIQPGRMEMYIDASYPRGNTIFVNSPLNEELMQHRKQDDSVLTLVYTKEMIEKVKNTSIINPIRDSLNTEYKNQRDKLERYYYQQGFSHTKSFLTLIRLNFWLTNYLRLGNKSLFTKEELEILFKKIDKCMRNYPTYIECKKMLKQKPNSTPDINTPLFHPK